ncbi:MAG TPA: phosphoribosyltransferase family protein [Solirubrobacterales bacterium]|nr:phosphoribosyltransferase family protein [Solirubrobacterales bacterium]
MSAIIRDIFSDRQDAGRQLAALLGRYAARGGEAGGGGATREGEDGRGGEDAGGEDKRGEVLVAGLARGGVPVAREVAVALGAPLEVFTVQKLGVPGQPELAMGAIASGGTQVVNDEVIAAAGVSPEEFAVLAAERARELERRERSFRAGAGDSSGGGSAAGDSGGGGDSGAGRLDVAGRTVILVDDGLATGASMRAAIQALRKQGTAAVIAAVPVAPLDTCAEISALADHCVCVHTPEPFYSVGAWYQEFPQVADEEVRALLSEARG